MHSKPNIVLIAISHFLPGFKYGGPISSIINMIDSLHPYYEFKLITSNREFRDRNPYKNIESNRWLTRNHYQIFYLKRGLFSFINLIRQINTSNAEVVYLNSFFNPLFSICFVLAKKFRFLKTKNILIAPRGELLEGALEFSKTKKKLYLRFAWLFNLYKNIYWHATSIEEKLSIIKIIRATPENIRVANVLSNISVEDPVLSTLRANNEHINSKKVLRIVYISRICKKKNLLFTLQVLKHVQSEVVFDIYGPIEDEYVWRKCLTEIEKMPLNIKVKYWGNLSRDDVKKTINKYDLFFFPTFSENFGHVIAESLSVGTPVLISDQTPWRNLEAKGWGWDFSLDSIEPFMVVITRLASLSRDELNEVRTNILRSYYEYHRNPEFLEANRQLFDFSKLQ